MALLFIIIVQAFCRTISMAKNKSTLLGSMICWPSCLFKVLLLAFPSWRALSAVARVRHMYTFDWWCLVTVIVASFFFFYLQLESARKTSVWSTWSSVFDKTQIMGVIACLIYNTSLIKPSFPGSRAWAEVTKRTWRMRERCVSFPSISSTSKCRWLSWSGSQSSGLGMRQGLFCLLSWAQE